MSNVPAAIDRQAWYQKSHPLQWKTVIASNLGWVFDVFEAYALILTVGTALHQLPEPSQYSQIPAFAGGIIAITLIGWAVGGIIGGVLAVSSHGCRPGCRSCIRRGCAPLVRASYSTQRGYLLPSAP